MKKTVSIWILASSISGLFAQQFEVPQNYVIKAPEDYAKYEKDFIQCFDWLMSTPANKEADKRMDAGAFMMKWLTGTPNFKVVIRPKIVNFMDVNPDLVLIFMGGWAKNVLQTQDTSMVNNNLKGIESVILFYQTNRGTLQKDKHVESYIKMKEAGTLEAYIRKNVF